MAIFKCKMCGGALEINNESVAMCEYCGTQQTLPKLNDDRKANLYDRANHFRRNNEFDKAMGIYEQILNEDPADAETYWSLVLCRYGIEYVEDPTSRKRVPTVNRAQFTSVFDDDNYKSALQYADSIQKSIYEAEAKAINEIQKGILEISQKEEPFDVFICYKETDNNGRRTPDSVLATELYHELIKEGFKVFFSRITLEDKLGTAYEPYIFAALNSAKVMVVLGTKQEYFNAVWVKNEWSRYLALIKQGQKKMLIPAYKDMDPYDLPEEFSHLQAQDMSKLGFMQDLVRGIKKITAVNKPEPTAVKETIINNEVSSNATALLKRGFLALEDSEWAEADNFFEQCLSQNAEFAEAYLGKLMAELKVKTRGNLANCALPFNGSNNYKKAVRFGDEALVSELEGYIKHINERNENNRLKGIYNKAFSAMSSSKIEDDFKQAAYIFKSISGYKDSDKLAEDCLAKAEQKRIEAERNRLEDIYNQALSAMSSSKTEDKFKQAADIFKSISGYKDSDKLAEDCLAKAEQKRIEAERNRLEYIYNQALSAMSSATTEDKFYLAADRFESISGYKDSDKLAEDCLAKAEEKRIEAERNRETAKKEVIKIGSITVAVLIGVVLLAVNVIIPASKYKEADVFAEKGDYANAAICYGKAGGYKDAKEKSFELWDEIAVRETISTSDYHTIGLKSDGTVVAVGENDDGQCDVDEWTDIVAVAADYKHTVGLKSDGTVVAVGHRGIGKCNVGNWKNIVAIAAGSNYTIGLKSDGTVAKAGFGTYGECKIGSWKNIVAIAAGSFHTVGLKSDGTVVAVGLNDNGQCNVEEWTDIVAVSAGWHHTVGLKSDGTVVAVGLNDNGQCNVEEWTDIVAVSAGDSHTVGLKSDGTVVAVGSNYDGRCDVSGWTDIVAVSAGDYHTVGLKADGTVVAVGDNDDGQCDVSDWTDIKLPE